MRQELAYRYRLWPTPEQEQQLLRQAGACRWLWNAALAYTKAALDAGMKRPGYPQLCRWLTARRHDAATAWLAETNAHAQQQALRNLDRAWRDAFAVEGRRPPTWKAKRKTAPSFRLVDVKDFYPVAGGVHLAGVGKVRWTMHRPLRGALHSVTVTREADGSWWASVQAAHWVAPGAPAPAGSVRAADRGVATALVTDDGQCLEIQGQTAAQRRKEARLAQAVSRTTRGSARRRQAQRRLATHQRRAVRRRRHAAHQAANALMRGAETVVLERLDVAAMTASAKGTAEAPGSNVRQKAGLNRSILDRAWGEVERILAYKCWHRGKRLATVPAAYSSQTCAACGVRQAEARETQARFVCGNSACTLAGVAVHADHNAARVLAQRYRAGAGVEVVTPAPGDAAHAERLAGQAARRARARRRVGPGAGIEAAA